MKRFNRREFSKFAALTGAGTFGLPLFAGMDMTSSKNKIKGRNANLKISLNAFSFDKPLKAGTMSLDDLLDFCARTGFDGVDLTGYYFPGYPAVPADDYIFHIKRKAFRLGIDLGCTGVRNDFTWADPVKREGEKKLVRDWIDVARKLGAPGLRIFAGVLSKEEFSWEQRAKWIVNDIRECADYGKANGVMIALQNHNDFIKSAADVEKIMRMVDHSWVGLMLDIGSYHSPDPYKDIAATAGYAITWQMKEQVFVNETQVETDYEKIIKIVRECGYSGYLPLETLGEGDPYTKVETLYKKVYSILNK
ncbi:MAG: sugar phosphate isomerase/epimerase [Bacteroidales bacterium]|nr:sugar phosphate isomerase/epimerase [Bacteroidales bacterium]